MNRLGIIYDVSKKTSTGQTIGWAYYLRALALQKYAPPDFTVDIFAYREVPWHRLDEYDCWFNIEYACPVPKARTRRPWVISFNSDSRRRHKYWPPVKKTATYTIFNNVEAFDHYQRPENSCCISNGIDPDLWYPEVPIAERPHRILWCGSSGPTKGKGYQEIMQPLENMRHEFETDFRPIDDINEKVVRPYSEQREWYNSGSYQLCASISEGTPGTSLEAMACGCVLVTLRVGNAQELGRDKENLVFVDTRNPQSFLNAVRYASEHRERISQAAVETMRGWTYPPPGNRAAYFFALFRALIEGRTPNPFSYHEVAPEDI